MTTIIRTQDFDAAIAEMKSTDDALRFEAQRRLRARGITRPEPHEVTHEMRSIWIEWQNERRRACEAR